MELPSPKTPPDGAAPPTVVVLKVVLRVVAVADAMIAGLAVDGLDAGADGADPDEPPEEPPPVEPLDGTTAPQFVGGAGLNPEPV